MAAAASPRQAWPPPAAASTQHGLAGAGVQRDARNVRRKVRPEAKLPPMAPPPQEAAGSSSSAAAAAAAAPESGDHADLESVPEPGNHTGKHKSAARLRLEERAAASAASRAPAPQTLKLSTSLEKASAVYSVAVPPPGRSKRRVRPYPHSNFVPPQELLSDALMEDLPPPGRKQPAPPEVAISLAPPPEDILEEEAEVEAEENSAEDHRILAEHMLDEVVLTAVNLYSYGAGGELEDSQSDAMSAQSCLDVSSVECSDIEEEGPVAGGGEVLAADAEPNLFERRGVEEGLPTSIPPLAMPLQPAHSASRTAGPASARDASGMPSLDELLAGPRPLRNSNNNTQRPGKLPPPRAKTTKRGDSPQAPQSAR